MAPREKLDQKVFDDIYLKEVVEALEHDTQLDFEDIGTKYLQKGKCPNPKCGERTVYIARAQPFQLKCNRLNQCQYEEKTRERYSYLFENLSERFPKTEENPNATADAYLQRNRGFDISQLKGWYTQGRRKLKDGQWADTVRFLLCDGHWERLIDATAVKANGGVKAGIKKGMSYLGNGWAPPGQVINKGDRVYIVEGIFHAIALYLAGFKAIASISANNFPWELIEANKGKSITWVIALDDDPAGHQMIPKYLRRIREQKEIGWVALAGERDWDTEQFEQALNLADFAMVQKQEMPERFRRDIPTFVADTMVDWADAEVKAGRSPEPYLSQLLPRVEKEWELFEKIPARYHKVLGLMAFEQERWKDAITHFERATELFPAIGVKTKLDDATKALRKQEASAE